MSEIDRDTTSLCSEYEVGIEESGGTTKSSRTNEEGDYSFSFNQKTPTSGGSRIHRRAGRDVAKKKGKCKVPQSCSSPNEFVGELSAMRINRDSEVEVTSKRLDLEQIREERKTKKMDNLHLSTLLMKEHLLPEDENMKRHRFSMLYGNSSPDSDSSSSSSNSNVFDEWVARVFQQNQQIDRMILDVLISNPNLILGDHPPRERRRYRDREREKGEARLMEDYFVDNSTYDQVIFRRRFRMQKPVFLRIVDAVTGNDEYFQQRPDATGRQGLSPLLKCTGAMRVLAYGTSADAVDEYLKMSEAVTREALMNFVEGVISCFGDEYLRKPNEDDLARLLYVGEQLGFPGMIGSIGYMHWEWKNCPTTWAGQYAGKSGKPTIILEAVASYDLWIWHAFFRTPGLCNDTYVLHRSAAFSDVLAGQTPKVSYVVNGRENDKAYYLTDGIYPSWAAFVKSIISPQLRKHKLFAHHQEAIRKDVERAFRVLQARFAFLRHPCLIWDTHKMGRIMIACIIMHNMIVEDERETHQNFYDPTEFFNDGPTNRQVRSSTKDDDQPFEYSTERIADLSRYMTNREELRNREAHIALKNDLIEHLWQKFGTDI